MNTINVIKRGRGSVAMHQGHQYYRHCTYKNGNSFWLCKEYKISKCPGSLTVSPDQSVLKLKNHNSSCQSDDIQNSIDIIINEACEEAVIGKEPAPKVFNQALKQISEKGYDIACRKPIPTKGLGRIECEIR